MKTNRNLDRRDFLKVIGAGAAAAAMPSAIRAAEKGAKAKRPNVILVMTDDQGYGDLRCHGNKIIQTPHLDKLHAQSTRLTNFHVDPTCSPTRSALMAGQYSARTGVWHTIMGRSLLGKHVVTMADVFEAGGYRTGAFGKWHLGDNYPFRAQDHGFGQTLMHGGGGVGQTPDFWGNNYFDDTYWRNGTPVKCKGYCTDVWFTEAIGFMTANRNRPFFCYIPTNAPHGPYLFPQKYKDLYTSTKPLPGGGKKGRDARRRGAQRVNAAFYGMITNIDENMGRLVKQLADLKLADDTILIFMTDNGTSGGSAAGMRGRKGSEYDGGHRVPFFIRWPDKLKAGLDIARLTAHVDVLPTLIDLCGLEKPKGVKFDGTNLAPLLRGGDKDWPDRTLIVQSQRIEHPQKWRKCAVMTDRWRLVNGKQLHDMPADPDQSKDVAADHADVVARLRKAYERFWDSLAEIHKDYCRIILGSDKENPSRLTCHDWHGSPPWSQRHIRAGARGNGFWAVEIERDGQYRFELRRWPKGVDKFIEATKARLKIGDVDQTKDVPAGVPGASFTVELKAGKTRLQTYLTGDKSGQGRGAYFVHVKRL